NVGFYVNAAGNLEYFEAYPHHIYGVTAQDVQWAAQEFLKRNALTLGLATAEEGAQPLSPDWDLLEVGSAGVDRPTDLGRRGTNPFEGGVAGGGSASREPSLSRLDRSTHEAAGGQGEASHLPNLVQETLPNGVVLLINPAPSDGTVGISLAVRGGRHFEDWDSNGVVELLTRALTKGTTKHTADELAELVDYLGGHLDVSAAADHLRVEGLFASLDLRVALDLIAELAGQATFPEAEVANERDILLADIAARVDETRAATTDQLNFAMYGPDSAYGRPPLGRPSVVQGLTVDDLKRVYRWAFHPQNLVVGVVGDIDPAVVRDLAAGAFGAIPNTPLGDDYDGPAPTEFRAPTGFQRIVVNSDKAQTMSVIGLPGVKLTDPDYPAVRVVNAVLGETWLSRLFDRLRGKEGLAYGTYSQIPAYPDAGAITAHIGTRPEMWEAAVAGLRREFTLIATEGMTAEELASALSYARGAADIAHAGMQQQASYLATNVARNLPPDFEWRVLDRMLATDLATANAAAAKYFKPDTAWLAATGPIYGEAAKLE
ncbi:MAG TPA: pitrilysin family protein, partial [bacterium]|nr:pitrilysin family protein [bacterium]